MPLSETLSYILILTLFSKPLMPVFPEAQNTSRRIENCLKKVVILSITMFIESYRYNVTCQKGIEVFF